MVDFCRFIRPKLLTLVDLSFVFSLLPALNDVFESYAVLFRVNGVAGDFRSEIEC